MYERFEYQTNDNVISIARKSQCYKELGNALNASAVG